MQLLIGVFDIGLCFRLGGADVGFMVVLRAAAQSSGLITVPAVSMFSSRLAAPLPSGTLVFE